jgi:hypothetical protein
MALCSRLHGAVRSILGRSRSRTPLVFTDRARSGLLLLVFIAPLNFVAAGFHRPRSAFEFQHSSGARD